MLVVSCRWSSCVQRLLIPEGKTAKDLGFSRLLLAGAAGGVGYWVTAFPQDTIKSVMQTDKAGKYRNMAHCAQELFRCAWPVFFPLCAMLTIGGWCVQGGRSAAILPRVPDGHHERRARRCRHLRHLFHHHGRHRVIVLNLHTHVILISSTRLLLARTHAHVFNR